MCKDKWVPTVGKPAFVSSIQEWVVVVDVTDNWIVGRRASGGVANVYIGDVSEHEVAPPKTSSFVDADGEEVVVGCGIIEGQLMFWIDAPQESVTIAVDDVSAMINAFNEVLQ